MNKRFFSLLAAFALCLTLIPTTAFADDEKREEDVSPCSCETACTVDNMNKECPVCGAENAIPPNCGQSVSYTHLDVYKRQLWGSKVSPATSSELNKKAYVHIEDWRNRPLQGGHYPYVYVDGIYLRPTGAESTKMWRFW